MSSLSSVLQQADPLVRYFSSSGGTGGGLSSVGVLSSTPTVIFIDLNEWVRFDEPGTYRVGVSSLRVSDRTQKQVPNSDAPEPLQSPPFVLHIIPATSAWQKAKLQASLEQLAAVPGVRGEPTGDRKAAIADLRFLGNAGAIRALAANLREDRPDLMYQSAFGLMGVADSSRDAARNALEQRIEDPHFPICSWLLQTMAVLDLRGDLSPTTFYEERSRAHKEAWRKVLAALSLKEGTARAATAQTLLSNPPEGFDQESKTELARVLAGSFLDLTEEQRASALIGQWDFLQSPSILPALEASAKLPLPYPGSSRMNLYTRRQLKAAALARWYELDPEGATRGIASQIGSAAPSLTAQALAFLPEESYPQFEPLWAQRLLESNDYEEESVLAGLLVRFGTGSASGQVASKLKTRVGAWPCAPQAAALAYLVKFDPDQARPLLQQASSRLTQTGCRQSLFQDVSAHASGSVLNEFALSSLDDADRRVTMDALIYLADHGRKEDEKPIWDRYVKWSEQWSAKADVLDSNDRASSERIYPELAVGQNLARALIANQGWLASQNLITQVQSMYVGQQVCQQVQQLATLASPPYRVIASRYAASENYEVGQYSAKSIELLDQKIAQFLKGTAFQLFSTTPPSHDQTALQSEVQELFSKDGMSLAAAPPLTSH